VVIPGERYLEAEQSYKDIVLDFPFIDQTQRVSQDPFITYINRAWKPQLAILGADNLPIAKSAGNVLRPKTTIKFSLRIPPTLNG